MKFYQYLRAPNDVDGNPRRLFVLYEWPEVPGMRPTEWETPEIVGVFDERYRGMPQEIRDLPSIMTVSITATDYKKLKDPENWGSN